MTPHYGPQDGALIVYYGSDPVIIARKDRELKDLGDRAASGQLVLPIAPEPVTIYDQRWLLRLASEAYAMAAEVWRG